MTSYPPRKLSEFFARYKTSNTLHTHTHYSTLYTILLLYNLGYLAKNSLAVYNVTMRLKNPLKSNNKRLDLLRRWNLGRVYVLQPIGIECSLNGDALGWIEGKNLVEEIKRKLGYAIHKPIKLNLRYAANLSHRSVGMLRTNQE